MKFGCRSEIGCIERLLLKHSREAFISQGTVDRQWRRLHFSARPKYGEAIHEYDEFVTLLETHVTQIHFLPQHPETTLDSIYVHDPVIVTERGAILGRMGKEDRWAEPEAAASALSRMGVPVVGAITGEGRLEGGDVVVFDEVTLAVGQGARTNAEGIRQLRMLLGDMIQELVVVPLPPLEGPGDVLHLMSLISPVDHDLAVVYPPLLPVPFRDWLVQRGVELIEVPDQEFTTMGCNVLAIAPRKCLMLAGNPVTKLRLEQRNVEVLEYEGIEISLKGAGGPTCLTRPILRLD